MWLLTGMFFAPPIRTRIAFPVHALAINRVKAELSTNQR